MRHELKTWPHAFGAVLDGSKRHEIRRTDDRSFAPGDVLLLREYDPGFERYTDRSVEVEVTYLTPGGRWGLPPDLAVLSIRLVEQDT